MSPPAPRSSICWDEIAKQGARILSRRGSKKKLQSKRLGADVHGGRVPVFAKTESRFSSALISSVRR